jgi:multisite-specific tRNA:(cytosine-C5)-methyltransferase
MFPSGKGNKDISIVSSSSSIEVNTDVDTSTKDLPDIGEGEQETKILIDGCNNSANPNTELRTEVDCESGGATNCSKKLDSTSIRTEHSDYPLHHCMRIVPHDQNSGAFFVAVLHKLSPLNGSALVHLFCIFLCFFAANLMRYSYCFLMLKWYALHLFREPGGTSDKQWDLERQDKET